MKRNRIITLIIVGAVLTGLLTLDLANQGLAWRIFWNTTGEEAPLAQIRGMVDWLGNFTRAQPRTRPLVPINHAHENPYGINVFLQEEVEPEKRERILQMISEAGFTWIRQQFPWEDIEIHGRGDFEDRRNVDAVGVISAWDKYDQIVDLAEQYDIDIFARLDNPPEWSRSNPDAGAFAPPDDLQDFVNYVTTVAERYQGRIHYYQVWNEPNIFPEWGNQAVSPEGYSELLCRTYAALKAVDPEIVVISGALAPTLALTGRDLNDYIFLQRMYDAEAGDCFDVLGAQGYGFNSGPTDRRMRSTNINFAHNLYLRDIMVANGDEHKAIWITEAAWNPIDAPDVPPDVSGRANYGVVTPDQAARYMPLAYDRAQREWPWVGPIFYWFFKRPADFEANQSWYYFRMVEPDFTPLPVYDAMKDYITSQEPVLYPGVHQAEHWATEFGEQYDKLQLEGAEYNTAVSIVDMSFLVHGTDLLLRWTSQNPSIFKVLFEREHDGMFEMFWGEGLGLPSGEWHTANIPLSQFATHKRLKIEIWSGTELTLDSITVIDRTYENLFGPVAALLIGVGMFVWVVFRALQERQGK